VKKATALLIAALVLVPLATSQQVGHVEPYSVKNDKLGETWEEWLATDPTHKNWDCGNTPQIANRKTASCVTWGSVPQKDTYAGVL
jgi:hypothetical protein